MKNAEWIEKNGTLLTNGNRLVNYTTSYADKRRKKHTGCVILKPDGEQVFRRFHSHPNPKEVVHGGK
jgi:hypothetical protein